MPRCSLNRKKYKVSDLSKWLAGKMYELKLSQSDMAELIGISQPAFSNRMRKGIFSYSELLAILDKLKATDEEILKLMKM